MMKKSLLALAFYCITLLSYAQQHYTPADYKRIDSLVGTFNKNVFYSVNDVKWVENNQVFWYSTRTPQGIERWMVTATQLKKEKIFESEKLLKQLSTIVKKQVNNDEFTPFNEKISSDGLIYSFQVDTNLFEWNRKKSILTKTGSKVRPAQEPYWNERNEKGDSDPVKSPDGAWLAFIKDNNVFVKESKGTKQFQLSFDGSEGEYYSSRMQWSPDSKKIITAKVRAEIPHYIYFVESSPVDQLQPKLHKRYYPKAGDALQIYTPALFNVDKKKQIMVDGTPFLHQYSLERLEWRKNSDAFTFEFNERGHQRYQVVEVSANTGICKVLIDEKSKTFIDYSSKMFRYDVNDGKEIIWTSERDGWNHLYIFNGDGSIKNQITKGEWVVRKVEYVDEKNQCIYFTGSGKNTGEDPYLIHYYKVNFDGSNLVDLTPESANHKAFFSSDYKYFVDVYSRVDMPPTTILRSATDGKVVMNLEKADISKLLSIGWKMPEVFSSKGRDGVTDIWGIIYRPSNFDPSKKYPVIENIYAGPHSSHVPKSFIAQYGHAALAELGFIVVQIDGMGTSNRSKAFHDVCWRNLKDAGFPDRILWMKEMASKYSYIDITRVGIMGTSAGGQNAMGALLFHPDFYMVGVASCGCHDNRMDKIWWNEQWMGYPVGPWYEENSNVVNANRLQGKLLLMVGEVDDNVDPATTLQVCNSLIKAGKEFDLVVLPGMNHTGGGIFGERKRKDYFVKHLLGINIPDWNTETSNLKKEIL